MGILQNIVDGKKLRKERKVSPYVTMKELLAYFAFGGTQEDHLRLVGQGNDGQNPHQRRAALTIPTNSDHTELVEEFLDMSIGVTGTVDLMRRIKNQKPSTLSTGGLIGMISDMLGGGGLVSSISQVDDLIAAQIQVYFEDMGGDLDIGLIQPKQKHYRAAGLDLSGQDIATNDLSRYLLHGRIVDILKPPLNGIHGDTPAFDNMPPSIVSTISETEETYSTASADEDRFIRMIASMGGSLDTEDSVISVQYINSNGTIAQHDFDIGLADMDIYNTMRSIEGPTRDALAVLEARALGRELDEVRATQSSPTREVGSEVAVGIVSDAADEVWSNISGLGTLSTETAVRNSFLRQWFVQSRGRTLANGGDFDPGLQIVNRLSAASDEEISWAEHYGGDLVGNGQINSAPMNPDRLNSPNLSVIVIPSLDVNLNTRNTSHVALFSCGIPTVEMSLAVPFIKLQFEVAKASVMVQDGKESQASLGTTVTFLGDGTVQYGSADWGMQTGLGPGVAPSPDNSIGFSLPGAGLFGGGSEDVETSVSLSTRSGMEIFTSPQTMVNMNINSQRTQKILDPTQPMMSLDSVQIKEYLSGHGLIGFKRATVSMTLHDRTRLREVAHFIAPAQFGRVTAGIEFGWSHPHSDPAKGSPYGKFLNSLRNTAKYRLIKGTYNMDSAGQIKITLEMGTTGSEESKNIHACTGRFVELRLIEDILRDINAIHRQQKLSTGNLSAEIRDFTKLYERSTDATGTLVDVSFLIAAETIHREMMNGDKSVETAAQELGVLIKRFVEAPGSTYRTQTASSLMGDILESFEPTSPSPDPWLTDLIMGVSNTAYTELQASLSFASRSHRRYESRLDEKYVSLGKVMTSLIGKPLCASHRFDEVQMIFYGMNDSAGAMINYAISSFPIKLSSLRTQIAEYIENAGTITVNGVIRILTGMTNSASAEAYGFSDLYAYSQALGQENSRRNTEMGDSYTSADEDFSLNERLSKRMYHCGLFRPRFKVPVIKVLFESGPKVLCDEEGQQIGDVDETKHILRIHVYDQNASAHPGEQIVLDCLSDGEQTHMFNRDTVVAGADSRVETVQDRVETTMRTASTVTHTGGGERGILSTISSIFGGGGGEAVEYTTTESDSNREGNKQDEVKVPVFISSRDAIHDFIKTRIPTIQFGTAFSPFSEVTISGMSSGGTFDALLSNQFRDQSDPQTHQGSDPLVSEVQVVPVTAKAAGLGNPMFHPGQEFYLDLKTGTTADNIFTVRSVTHNISPGTFTSDVEFGPAGAFSSVSSIRSNLIAALASMKNIAEESTSEYLDIPVTWAPRLGSDEMARISGGSLDNGGYVDPPADPGGPAGRTWTQDEIDQLRELYPSFSTRIESTMRSGGSLDHLEKFTLTSSGALFDQ